MPSRPALRTRAYSETFEGSSGRYAFRVPPGTDPQVPSIALLSVFAATSWRGELTDTEPDKHLSVAWSPVDALPTPMFHTLHTALLAHLPGGRGFSTHGWSGNVGPRALVGS